MSTVLSFPATPDHERARAKLADQLTTIAEHIRRGEIEADPTGWAMVLMSSSGFEVLHVNMSWEDLTRASVAMEDRALEIMPEGES